MAELRYAWEGGRVPYAIEAQMTQKQVLSAVLKGNFQASSPFFAVAFVRGA